MRNKILVATLVAMLAILTLASVAAAKKPSSPGKPFCWVPTHYAVFTGNLDNTEYELEDQQVQDTRRFIYSDHQVNDFELNYGEELAACLTPSEGVQGYLSILKPTKKNLLEIRHTWKEGDSYFTLFCAGGIFEEDGDGFQIIHSGECSVVIGGGETEVGCGFVEFNINIDPIP